MQASRRLYRFFTPLKIGINHFATQQPRPSQELGSKSIYRVLAGYLTLYVVVCLLLSGLTQRRYM